MNEKDAGNPVQESLNQPSPCSPEDKDVCAGTSADEAIEKIRQAKDTVGRMLRYAIANPNIAVSDELIANGVDILRRESETFQKCDEVQLWQTYSQLSKLVYPASDISIQVADGFKDAVLAPEVKGDGTLGSRVLRWLGLNSGMSKIVSRCYWDLTLITLYLVVFVGLYVVVQCYSVLLADTLASSSKLIAGIESQQAAEHLVNDKTPIEQRQQVESASYMLGTQLNANSQALVDLTKPLKNIPFLSLSDSTVDALDRCAQNKDLHITLQQGRNLLFGCIALEREYALSAHTVLSRYVLPLILGFIGATAYVTRHTLYRLATNSYIPSPRGMLTMRLCLGGLLGAISGIFITSDAQEAEGFNISLTLTALVMGYSVEVAFSLFDSGIERIRAWTRGLRQSEAQTGGTVDPPES
ncbi:MAG: hypothetical protein ACU83P_04865 [Gammaproteobacteria bacterium]